MAYLPYPNKQINIPYLLKIGEGKLAKVGKYLVDKGLVNVALFWGEGLEDVFGQTLNQSLREYGIKTAYKQDVRYINIEEITKIALTFRPIWKPLSASAAAGRSILPNIRRTCSSFPLFPFRPPRQTTVFAAPIVPYW